jgi:branched-chain amino acid transport system substrate-binding protein
MQVAMLMPAALAANKKRWALVYPNFEYGQAAVETFKEQMKSKSPSAKFRFMTRSLQRGAAA